MSRNISIYSVTQNILEASQKILLRREVNAFDRLSQSIWRTEFSPVCVHNNDVVPQEDGDEDDIVSFISMYIT